MNFAVAAPYVLPKDVVLTAARSLPTKLRRELECADDDYAVRRKRSRTPSRVIDASTADLLRQFVEAKPITEAIIAFSRLNGSDPEQTLVEAFPSAARSSMTGCLCLRVRTRNVVSPASRLAIISTASSSSTRCRYQDSECIAPRPADGRLVAVKVARPGHAVGFANPRAGSCDPADP